MYFILVQLTDEFLIVASRAHHALFSVSENWNSKVIPGIPINDRPVVARYSQHTGYIYWMIDVASANFTITRYSVIKRKMLNSVDGDLQIVYSGKTGIHFTIRHAYSMQLHYYSIHG